MGSLKTSLWFNSIIALLGPPGFAKIIEVLTNKDPETMSAFFKMIKDNDMMFTYLLVIIISFVIATLGNISASNEKCNQVNTTSAMLNALKVPVFVTIGYFIGILVPQIQEPWIHILSGPLSSNTALVNILPYLVAGFMAMCLSWTGTALSHFAYMETACKPSDELISQKLSNQAQAS